MKKTDRIFIAGHRGLVGSAIVRDLQQRGFLNLVVKLHAELDLLNQAAVHDFFKKEKIDYVFLAAARVGGIKANDQYSADFMVENLLIATNVIQASALNHVEKLLFLGSSCIYPKHAPQPIREDSLLTGTLEPTNEAYALAKIAGLKLCEMYRKQYGKNFISAMPTNLYGPGDNFHPENSHVIPGMMRRFHEAKVHSKKEVRVWGTGTPKREFLHVDDLAKALFLLMENYSEVGTINVGTGEDLTIRELSEMMTSTVGFEGAVRFDPAMPDGTLQKVLDVSRMKALGWAPEISLREGLKSTYDWALRQKIFG